MEKFAYGLMRLYGRGKDSQGEDVIKPYTPTTLDSDVGHFKLVIKHLGKYFKQSAKGLEQQIAREARFYGALIRLQQNWKVKRHRMAASPGH